MSIRDRKREIQAIVSVFETGSVEGDYTAVALLKDGAGISYGAHQGTDRSGTLDAIVRRYLELGGTVHGLEEYTERLANNATTRVDPDKPPKWVRDLMTLLSVAGGDPLMRQAQEEIFDRGYWQPALQLCDAMGLELPLSGAVVYDSCIHSGPGGVARIRRKFPEVPPAKGGDERAWARAYVIARRRWLRSSDRLVVRQTVYRMNALEDLMQDGRWDLRSPFSVRGRTI